MFVVRRHKHNPLLIPSSENQWEGWAVFNWCPVDMDGKVHAVYRAMAKQDPLKKGPEHPSTIGYAYSEDGVHFSGRRQLIIPEHEWEKYGCEDPRVVKYGDWFYIFYTALSEYPFTPDGIRTAVAKTRDFKSIDSKALVTPFNSKAMTLFPEPIDGKMTAILTADAHKGESKMAIAQFDNPDDLVSEEYWKNWYESVEDSRINPRRVSQDQVEVGATPIKTPYGWLVIYAHIEHHPQKEGQLEWVYGTEAMLLDLHNPRKIICKTKGPFLSPEMQYERMGQVSDVVFPSGARVSGETLEIYYGAADTTCCIAQVNLNDLVETMYPGTSSKRRLMRQGNGPIITPDPKHEWEAKATFNPAAIDVDGVVHVVYRAMGHDDTSVMGLALSRDGVSVDEKLPEPIYTPRSDFENKKRPGNSGCEDPRLTRIGDRIYMLYTAFDAIGPARPAAAWISVDDFLARVWNWSEPALVSESNIDNKDACLLPRKVNGKYVLLHRVGGINICLDYLDVLDFEKEKANSCTVVLEPRRGMWDSVKVGIAGPPIETAEGWLLFYHGVSPVHHRYRVGIALLDLNDPSRVLARSADPILEPETTYEKDGIIPDVVFPCGSVERDGMIYQYYGGADTVTGVATIALDTVMSSLVYASPESL